MQFSASFVRATLGVLALGLSQGCKSPYPPPLPPATPEHTATAERLREHVTMLATTIGGRDMDHPEQLEAAAAYIEAQWAAQGYAPTRQCFQVRGDSVCNLEVERIGTTTPSEVVLVGAHYDTAWNNPGANDNGSGVAAMLELSRFFARQRPARTLRFVAFVNEEPPYFHTEAMGSLVYARAAAQRGDDIVGMFSLETMGYYTIAPDSQHYPKIIAPLYPARGNFVAAVSNGRSRKFVKQVVRSFRSHTRFPIEFIAATDEIQGIGWSDHWSFYKQGYPAVMITDTAPNRYEHYHTAHDTPDKLDYASTSHVVLALRGVIGDLAL